MSFQFAFFSGYCIIELFRGDYMAIDNDKFKEKIQNKYGERMTAQTLAAKPISEIKIIRNVNKKALSETKKFKTFRRMGSTIAKGASIGAGVSGTINTLFPNVVPVIASAITAQSKLSGVEKTLSYALAASKPVDLISGYGIIGIGAGIGVLLYGGYRLIKCGAQRIAIAHDKGQAKKLVR